MVDFAAARRMMVEGQIRTYDVTDLRVLAAMLEVPREYFVPEEKQALAYVDRDLVVGSDGHAPRHLDRNIAVVGRVIEGIDRLSSLPRGTEALGFYKERSQDAPPMSGASARRHRATHALVETDQAYRVALTKLIGPTPWTPPDLNAISAHLYVGEDREKLASVHFYGADRCDVGFDADMPATLLNQIIAKVGARI